MGRIAVYCIILAFAAVPLFYNNTVTGYLAPLMLICLGIANYIYILLLRRSFECVEQAEAANCKKGGKLKFSLVLSNKGFLVYPHIRACFIKSNVFEQAERIYHDFTLNPFENKQFSFEVDFEHLGKYSVGLEYAEISDFLGLFRIKYHNKERSSVEVQPQLMDAGRFELKNINASQNILSSVKSKFQENDYAGVREYSYGDSLKNIHWKLSAHSTGHMTKLFENYATPSATIYMDFDAPGCTPADLPYIYDGLIETAYSVSHCILAGESDIELVFPRDGNIHRLRLNTPAELQPQLSCLPLVSADSNYPFSAVLDEYTGTGKMTANIMLILSANIDNALLNKLAELKNTNRDILLFNIAPAAAAMPTNGRRAGIGDFIEAHGIGYHVINDVSDVKDALREVTT
ncbi:hypothetical protein CLHUN_32850 [Ruminiclostridium hungatei]|uniref:Uncharacterized protein n=1 Tax=Ruminiclostridium hungatei TaxID=48256 RepID=A0A1V4SHT5_RUMHU|nr:DUF58 domain-containing protein [Ruminiclostridium hungatei]OPX42801.1 hypothetical protein CLHUN_32850 [Ruminiclostridium hungatei]